MADRKADAKARGSLDVLVAGAGYVGLAAAVSLKQARPSLTVAIVDAAPAGVWQRDGRASAIAAAACRMLDQLGVWQEIAPEAQAITEMIVTDSRTSDPVRPVFLTFDGEVAPGEPFAHMVANTDLNGALRRRAQELGIDIIEGVAVGAVAPHRGRLPRLRQQRRRHHRASGRWRDAEGAAAGRSRWRQLEIARHGRHQDGEMGIWPVRHRLHRGA
jgi:2-polyprenyl-6-methoxyphenol hydroxylase-like FAD-dependent oxidoreductase